ncbi:MAG: hypothetical protein ACOX88_07370 [Christensenellales bacterium]|jgi:hypothetical protein
MEKRVLIDYAFTPAINFSMQQNAVPVLRQLTIKNQTDTPIENIELHISSSPEFIIPLHKQIDILPVEDKVYLGSFNLIFFRNSFFHLQKSYRDLLN